MNRIRRTRRRRKPAPVRVARNQLPFDAAIAALARARSLPARLDALAEVIYLLHGIRQKVPNRKLAARDDTPLALRWLYANYGHNQRITGRFNRILPPEDLKPGPGNVVTFLAENQGVFLLGYRPGPADPVVVGSEHGSERADAWSLEDITVSQALAAHILAEFAMMTGPAVYACRASTRSLLDAVEGLTFLPFGWRVTWNLHLWAGRGAMVVAVGGFPRTPRKGDPWQWTIHAAARRRRDLAFLDPLLPTWDLDNPGGHRP